MLFRSLQIRSNVWHLDVDNASVETAAVHGDSADADAILEIGRASCRERV